MTLTSPGRDEGENMNTENIQRLKTYINEGRLIRNKWVGEDAQGRETACLLAALSPEVAKKQSPNHCPADIMPKWLAYLTTKIDDNGSLEKWPEVVNRFADLASRWHVLSDIEWDRANFKVKKVCVLEAMKHTTDEKPLKACRDVVSALDREIAGDKLSDAEWSELRTNAAAAHAADAAAAHAAAAAAYAAYAARLKSWDSMIDGFLDVIEDEIKMKEN